MVKKGVSDTFEIVVVLSIVAIVALTGQVLIYFEGNTNVVYSTSDDSLISGLVIAEETVEGRTFTDVSVQSIDVNPPSPMIGDPFRVTVFLKNTGTEAITTPIFIELSFEPRGDGVNEYEQLKVVEVMPQVLEPGQETSVSSLVTTIVPEGPLRIVATADSTAKLDDHNAANNQLSKTIIVVLD